MEKTLFSAGLLKSTEGSPAVTGPMTGRVTIWCHSLHFLEVDKPGDGAGEQKGCLSSKA